MANIFKTTDEAAVAKAASAGALIENLWAPWNSHDAGNMADVLAALAKPHRVLSVRGTIQIWSQNNAHVVEIH